MAKENSGDWGTDDDDNPIPAYLQPSEEDPNATQATRARKSDPPYKPFPRENLAETVAIQRPGKEDPSKTLKLKIPEFGELREDEPEYLGKTTKLKRMQIEAVLGSESKFDIEPSEQQRLVAEGINSVREAIAQQDDPALPQTDVTVEGISPGDASLEGELWDHPSTPALTLPDGAIARESVSIDGNAHLILNDRTAEELRHQRGPMNKRLKERLEKLKEKESQKGLNAKEKLEKGMLERFGTPATYTIKKKLGQGGFGAVFLAEDAVNKGAAGPIAVKIVVTKNEEAKKRLKRQMKVMADLGEIDGILEGKVLRPLHPDEKIDLEALGMKEEERDSIFIEETMPIRGRDLKDQSYKDRASITRLESAPFLVKVSNKKGLTSHIGNFYFGRAKRHLSLLEDIKLSDGRTFADLPDDEPIEKNTTSQDQVLITEAIAQIHDNIIIDIGIDSLKILSKAHEQGISHRDFKPENVMIDEKTGDLTVIDWGLVSAFVDEKGNAKTSSAMTRPLTDTMGSEIAREPTLTHSDDILGTPYFLCPEYITAEAGCDDQGDRWAVAVSLCNLLTGDFPFPGGNVGEVMDKIVASKPVPIAQSRSKTSPELQGVINKALQKKRGDRFKTDDEMIAALEESKHKSAASVQV